MFNLKFSTGNAAFEEYPEGEISRILNQIKDKVFNGYESGKIMDSNGNGIGKWEWSK